MINTETVLIIGAGGSQPYGFPLGKTLINNICESLNDNKFKNILLSRGFNEEIINKFRIGLEGSKLESIDAFLEYRNEDEQKLGKDIITLEILKYPLNKIINENDDWYGYLWNRMVTQPEKVEENKISFITYNYDLSMEYYLFNVIKNTFGLTSDKAQTILAKFNIVHLHGKIGIPPWQDNFARKVVEFD